VQRVLINNRKTMLHLCQWQAVVVAGRRSTPLTMKQLTKHETRQTANKHKINNNDNNNDDDNDNDNNKNNNKNNSPHQRREEGGGAGQ
jgi:hypothetical protein